MRRFVVGTLVFVCAVFFVSAETKTPNTDAVLRLVGRFGIAHACPIAPDLALTAAHVVDPQPFSEAPLFPQTWSDGSGHTGVLYGLSADNFRDLARVKPQRGTFPAWYPVSRIAPKPGDHVFALGYDYGSKGSAYGDKLYDLRVVRVLGGTIITDRSSKPGSSGGCVLNVDGQVVGIVMASQVMNNTEEIGLMVGVWGDLLNILGRSEPKPEVEIIVLDGGVK